MRTNVLKYLQEVASAGAQTPLRRGDWFRQSQGHCTQSSYDLPIVHRSVLCLRSFSHLVSERKPIRSIGLPLSRCMASLAITAVSLQRALIISFQSLTVAGMTLRTSYYRVRGATFLQATGCLNRLKKSVTTSSYSVARRGRLLVPFAPTVYSPLSIAFLPLPSFCAQSATTKTRASGFTQYTPYGNNGWQH